MKKKPVCASKALGTGCFPHLLKKKKKVIPIPLLHIFEIQVLLLELFLSI